MSQQNEYKFEIDDKENNPVQSNDLIVPESMVRMRILYRWALVLEDEKDIQCISKLKDINYVSTGYEDVFSLMRGEVLLGGEFKTSSQPSSQNAEIRQSRDSTITSSEGISTISSIENESSKANNTPAPININDFLFDTSFLPKIPNYRWVRRPIRNGYLYVYKNIKDQNIKMSEYLINDGKLHLITKDLIEENQNNEYANRNDTSISLNKTFDDYWHSDTIDKKDQLAEYGFAYSECRWSIQYINHLVDLNNEEDRDKRFQKINTEEYYNIFKESILNCNNKKFVQYKNSNRDLHSQFSLADNVNYNFQSGQQYNAWEFQKFGQETIDTYIEQDVTIMTQSHLGGTSSTKKKKKPTMVLNATLIDHLGAIDDVIEDMTSATALFNSLVESLGKPYSEYEKYNESLEGLIQGKLDEGQNTGASTKMIDLLDNQFPEAQKLEKKDIAALVQNKYSFSFKNAGKGFKMLSHASKVINSNKTQIKEEEANDLYLTALLLYKILYSPDSEKIVNSHEFKETCLEQTNKDIIPSEKLKKYRKCVQQEKIEKILAVKERAELRNLILRVKNSLGFFLKEQVLHLHPALDDYCQNTESRKLEGKQRFNLIINLLTINPRTVDKFLDITSEEREKQYEEDIYAYDKFLVKCYEIPSIKPADYEEDKLLKILHTPIDLDELVADKSYQAQKEDQKENINAFKNFSIILSTHINLSTHIESQINKGLVDLRREMYYNDKGINKHNTDLTQKKNETIPEQDKHDRFEKQTNKTRNNTTIREESLLKLDDIFHKNVQEIAKIGNDPAIILEAKKEQLATLLEDGENRGSYHANSLQKEINTYNDKLKRLKELEKEQKKIDKKIIKSKADITRRNEITTEMESVLGKRKENLKSLNEEIRSLENKIAIKKLHRENLLNRRRELMNRQFSSKMLKFNQKIGNVTNHPTFKGLSFILGSTSFIRAIYDFEKDVRSTVFAVGAFSDLASILADLSLGLRQQIKYLPGSLRSKVHTRNTFYRGATRVSHAFCIVGTLSNTIISFMDMKAAYRKGDNVSGGLNLVAGIAGVLSTISLIIIGVTKSTSIILASMSIYGMFVMLLITLLIMIFSYDDFQLFLKATVFSSGRPIEGIASYSPYRVRYQLCTNKAAYGENDCIYEETFNSGFRVKDGEAKPSKRKIDLKVFKNMIDYIYNLMVGFGAQATIPYKDGIKNAKGAKAHVYNHVIFTLFFNGYDYATSEFEVKLHVFTAGIGRFMDNPDNADFQKYTFVEIEEVGHSTYGDINPLGTKLGVGIKPKFTIADEINNHLKILPQTEIDKDKICYVLFFRFKMNNGVWWPFDKGQSEDPVYVALKENIHDPSTQVTRSRYYSGNSDSYRHTIADNGVYIGTRKEILGYLKNIEKK